MRCLWTAIGAVGAATRDAAMVGQVLEDSDGIARNRYPHGGGAHHTDRVRVLHLDAGGGAAGTLGNEGQTGQQKEEKE